MPWFEFENENNDENSPYEATQPEIITPDINELNRRAAFKDKNEVTQTVGWEPGSLVNIRSGSTSTSALPQYISNVTGLKIAPEYVILKPFYRDDYMERLANAYFFDDVINSAVERLAYFTLGTSDELRSILYPDSIRPLNSELEAKNALKEIKIFRTSNEIANSIVNSQLSDQEVTNFETYVHQTDKNCKLVKFLKKNYRASHIFSRSASYIEYSTQRIDDLGMPAGTPVALKPLKPMQLGNVAIDTTSWDIKAVQYNDSRIKFKDFIEVDMKQDIEGMEQIDRQRYIPANNLLYFVRNNNSMMKEEDDFYFGHSTLQPILNQSEENRRLQQIVIPSINQQLWAGVILWQFPNWTNAQMTKFFGSIRPGQHIGIPRKDITATPLAVNYDYGGLLNLKMELKKGMLSVFGMPSFLMNFEEANTKATADAVVIGFNESTIQAERSWLTDILDEQWYANLFRTYFPSDEFIHIKLKIMVEFENISFESFLEKAVSVVSLIEKKIITLSEGRNLLKMPPLKPEDYAELGITNPNAPMLTDPMMQTPPETPNLLQTLLTQKNQQVQQQQQQQQSDNPAADRFNSKVSLSGMKSQLLNK